MYLLDLMGDLVDIDATVVRLLLVVTVSTLWDQIHLFIMNERVRSTGLLLLIPTA